MSWHYQMRQHTAQGIVTYDIVERHYNHGHSLKVICTNDMRVPSGETKEALIAQLEVMLRDVKQYPVLNEEEAV